MITPTRDGRATSERVNSKHTQAANSRAHLDACVTHTNKHAFTLSPSFIVDSLSLTLPSRAHTPLAGERECQQRGSERAATRACMRTCVCACMADLITRARDREITGNCVRVKGERSEIASAVVRTASHGDYWRELAANEPLTRTQT